MIITLFSIYFQCYLQYIKWFIIEFVVRTSETIKYGFIVYLLYLCKKKQLSKGIPSITLFCFYKYFRLEPDEDITRSTEEHPCLRRQEAIAEDEAR